MSIREVANDIIIKSHQHIQKVYKELDINFKMEIKPNIISINISGAKIQFNKQKSNNLNSHVYFLDESHKEYATELTYEIVKEVIPFVYEYMEANQHHEKLDGYVIRERYYAKESKGLQEVILETDPSSFSDEEREYAACMFESFSPYLYVAKLSYHVEEYIKKAILTVKNIQEVLPNYLLCRPIGNPIYLMKSNQWSLQYHGEEISFRFIEKEHAIHIELIDLERTYKYDLPLEKEQITNLLEMIEEENRLKNLTQPETFFFSNFAMKNIKINNTYELFDELVDMIGDWEQVELIFQDINAKLESNESPLKKQTLFDDSSIPRLTKSVIEDETDFRYNIVCFDLQYKSYHFKFIRHLDFNSFTAKEYPEIKRLDSNSFNNGNAYLFLGQLFITSRNEESQEITDYIQKFFNKASEMKKQLK
ncbi:hypothetical protein [Bacillus thuringiensis]|uniref:hypothetical protein n=1 Tax=Bacillus thuringiensis TaxID=1428 RepID=UPI0021D68A3B|nr:hypothetical protein [Bacillus thuringiensis]MCU7667681.1 hypothetical protein [Bacillus thuringiensis]